eukprot:10684999-Alexandrium_andersonii.AAC.1
MACEHTCELKPSSGGGSGNLPLSQSAPGDDDGGDGAGHLQASALPEPCGDPFAFQRARLDQ